MTRLSLLLLAASLAGIFPASAADEKPAEERPRGRRVLELTLSKAVRFALGKNFTLEAERYSPKIARERVRSAWGRFDPELDVSYRHGEQTVRENFGRNALTGQLDHFRIDSNSQDDTLSVGVSGVTVWGLGYDLGASTVRNNSAGASFSPEYTSEVTFGLTQPLLRGAGRDVNLAAVRIARNNVSISEWGLKEQIIDVITQVVVIYNELHFTQQNLAVSQRSQALAKQLLQDNIKRVEAGVMTPLDVTTAQAEVAAREDAVLRAQRDVKDQENFLKQLITADLLPLLGTQVEIAPPKAPEFYANVVGGVKEALELRPDYRQAKLDLANRHITVTVEKNNRLPRLDLTASLRLLGVDDDFTSSQARVANRDQSGWTAGATFNLPLGNNEAKGRYNAATLEAAQALVRLQQLEQTIVVRIDNAYGAVVTARERIEANVESSRLAKESLAAGEKRLVAGTGTVFEVLELQKNLAEAETAELRSRADYHDAIARYQQQTGTTLRAHGVKVE